ncbi:hypothetical protein POM88_045142 [Heracleum sosnowskyi]|uniref:Dicer-like protein n=1 Tax=Heracleum sosnowskyi TaxID=360622 RepID=A0AAD8H5X4_9APIA|nr:hypothetical protein POM88_045142 [Heracleum sosnowskyi]
MDLWNCLLNFVQFSCHLYLSAPIAVKKIFIATTKIPTVKVLDAITTKKFQEKFDLESLEAFGDSFLKYAACQPMFKLGYSRKLPGFMRNEPLDHKMWIVPGDQIENFREIQLSTATKVDFLNVPCTRSLPANPSELLNIKYLESILMYSFSDASLLVEALTHGSLCYRRFPSVISVLSFLEILYWIIS